MTINDGLNIKEGGIRSFLLIGQSNMAGRGLRNEAIPVDTSHIKVLRNGRWQPMYRQIFLRSTWSTLLHKNQSGNFGFYSILYSALLANKIQFMLQLLQIVLPKSLWR